MRTFILAAAALAAFSAAPTFAMEGNFQPTVTASDFGPARGPVAAKGGSFHYNNAGNYGDNFLSFAPSQPSIAVRIQDGSFVFSMTNGNG
jgi:hypothetical protein